MGKGITTPVEDVYYKYPVLKIPTEKEGELLIMGLNKARAVLTHISAIRDFVSRHNNPQREEATS